MFQYNVSANQGFHYEGDPVRHVHHFKFETGLNPSVEQELTIERVAIADLENGEQKYSILVYVPSANILTMTFTDKSDITITDLIDRILLAVEMGNELPNVYTPHELVMLLDHVRTMLVGKQLILSGVEVPVNFNGGERYITHNGLTVSAHRIRKPGYSDIFTVINYEGPGVENGDASINIQGCICLRHLSRPLPIGNSEVTGLLDKHLK